MPRLQDVVFKKGTDEPPYLRIAALNAYNLALFVAGLVVSWAIGASWLAMCVCAAETVWLLFAPESKLLKRLWFDPVWTAAIKAEDEARIAARATSLTLPDQGRVRQLREQRARIEGIARENPTFGAQMLVRELDKLDGLVSEFVDRGVAVAQRERHLATFDLAGMRRSWDTYLALHQGVPAGDPRREVAARNLDVLKQRFERHEELTRSVQAARGQMDLIESSFRLLADEIVTMGNPSELGERLDELRIAVDAIRDATRDAELEEEPFEEERLRAH